MIQFQLKAYREKLRICHNKEHLIYYALTQLYNAKPTPTYDCIQIIKQHLQYLYKPMNYWYDLGSYVKREVESISLDLNSN